MHKLDTLVADYPDTYKLTGQDEVSKTYSFPKSYISYLKSRAISTGRGERERQMMIAKNGEKEDFAVDCNLEYGILVLTDLLRKEA